MNISLLVTTYNRPDALELVLRSIANQSMKPFEVLIADDGSQNETLRLIEDYQKKFSVPLIHCWQTDQGFRASRIRNIAIARARGDYIVMIDGDMVLHHHFIRDHHRIAAPNQFVQGRRAILTEQETQRALATMSLKFSLFSPGVKNKLNTFCNRFLSPIISSLYSQTGSKSVRSCNMAIWRTDAIKINGFNEAFIGWGREDTEFVVRLLNAGITRKDLRLGGIAYHLYHQENSKDNLTINDILLAETKQQGLKYCELGLSQHLTK